MSGSSGSELRAKVFSLEETKFLKRKTVDPLNANEQDSPPIDTIKEILTYVSISFIMKLGRAGITIGFQDSCDRSFIANMPIFRAIEADL